MNVEDACDCLPGVVYIEASTGRGHLRCLRGLDTGLQLDEIKDPALRPAREGLATARLRFAP